VVHNQASLHAKKKKKAKKKKEKSYARKNKRIHGFFSYGRKGARVCSCIWEGVVDTGRMYILTSENGCLVKDGRMDGRMDGRYLVMYLVCRYKNT